MLLDKEKLSRSYLNEVPFYGEKLNIEGNLYGDFSCVILPSEKISRNRKSFKLTSPMYTKRYSGILMVLKKYFDQHETYARRVYKVTENGKYEIDNKGTYCSFNSDGVIINIFFHNETDHRDVDKFILNTIEQLIYITQIRSGQLTTMVLKNEIAQMGDKTTQPIKQILDLMLEKQKENQFLSARCDLLNQEEYCFDFMEKDPNVPKKYEKHCIITGSTAEEETFFK